MRRNRDSTIYKIKNRISEIMDLLFTFSIYLPIAIITIGQLILAVGVIFAAGSGILRDVYPGVGIYSDWLFDWVIFQIRKHNILEYTFYILAADVALFLALIGVDILSSKVQSVLTRLRRADLV